MSASLLKKLGLVTTILILALAVYLSRLVPREKSPFAKAADQAVHIIMEQGQKKVDLRKENGSWKVSSGAGDSYTVEKNPVETLVSGLKELQIEDEISDRADRAAEYEVNLESGTHVRLLGDKDSPLAEGIFGKQAPDFSHIYFRYVDKPNVYLARGLTRSDLGTVEVNSWRSRELISIPETQIQGILIAGNGFKTDLVRVGTETWTLNGKAVDPGLVNGLVGILAHLRADDFVNPTAYPQLTYDSLAYSRVLIKGAEASIDLRIGAQEVKSKRYPVSTGKEAGLAWLTESSAQSILKKPAAFAVKK